MKVRMPLPLRAELERQAIVGGKNYRDHLISLVAAAVEEGYTRHGAGVTKETRLQLDDEMKQRIKELAAASACRPEEWLLSVFREAVSEAERQPGENN